MNQYQTLIFLNLNHQRFPSYPGRATTKRSRMSVWSAARSSRRERCCVITGVATLRSEPSSVSSARRGSTRPTSSESTKEFTRKHNLA